MVRVVHGCNELQIQPGPTIAAVRKSLREVFNIPPDAIALLNGEEVSSDYHLAESDNLEFVKEHGEKGVGQVWTEDEFCKLFQLSKEQLKEQISKGMKVLQLADGSIRISETATDEFIRGGVSFLSTEDALPIVVRPTATALGGPSKPWGVSPYLDAVQAAAYLGITLDSLYGLVERRRLVPLRGPRRRYRFTTEMLDEYMRREEDAP